MRSCGCGVSNQKQAELMLSLCLSPLDNAMFFQLLITVSRTHLPCVRMVEPAPALSLVTHAIACLDTLETSARLVSVYIFLMNGTQ